MGALLLLSAGSAALGIAQSPGPTTHSPGLALPSGPPTFATNEQALANACLDVRRGALLGLTTGGAVVVVNTTTGHVVGTLANRAAPGGGLALDARHSTVYVTGVGPDDLPAVWSLECGRPPNVVEPDAELPAVSPGGTSLAYVMLDGFDQQTGVGIVSLDTSGDPAGRTTVLASTSVPVPIPIKGLALGPNDSVLAVTGGFVAHGLAPHAVTTGTLDPRTARSLGALHPIITLTGISIPPSPVRAKRRIALPKVGTTAAVYLPNGEVLVGGGGQRTGVVMPFRDRTVGAQGGGFRSILRATGPVDALAAGPGGAVAWVSSGGRLSIVEAAWDLPFGPQAMGDPYTPPTPRTVTGDFATVAWTPGHSKTGTTLPPLFHMLTIPTLAGMPEPQAVAELDNLAVPSFVTEIVARPTVPADTVLWESPPAGTQMACQCGVGLVITPGGTPVTGSAPANAPSEIVGRDGETFRVVNG